MDIPPKPRSVHRYKWHQNSIPLARSVPKWNQDFADTSPVAGRNNSKDCVNRSCMSATVLKLPKCFVFGDQHSVTEWTHMSLFSFKNVLLKKYGFPTSHVVSRQEFQSELPNFSCYFVPRAKWPHCNSTTPNDKDTLDILSTAQVGPGEYVMIRS